MSFERVKNYLENEGYGDRITVHNEVCDTVEHAAAMIGCEPERIAKTMSFLLDDEPVVIISAGDAKIDNRKYKDYFHKKAKMIPWDDVEKVIGHEPGGVCALAVNEGVKAYMDISLKRFTDIHTAAGAVNCTVHLTVDELEKLSNKVDWVDVCKGWPANE